MGAVEKLETQLDVWFNKQAPIKLPPGGRKAVANALWWVALVFGILQLWAVWALWHLGHVVDQVVTYNNYVAATYGYASPVTHVGLFYWLAFLALAANTVILLVAAPKLKQMHKDGWNLLYYSVLVYVAYAVLGLFDGVGGVMGDFFGAVISTIVSLFFLFQVRDHFVGAKAAHAATPATASHHAKKK